MKIMNFLYFAIASSSLLFLPISTIFTQTNDIAQNDNEINQHTRFQPGWTPYPDDSRILFYYLSSDEGTQGGEFYSTNTIYEKGPNYVDLGWWIGGWGATYGSDDIKVGLKTYSTSDVYNEEWKSHDFGGTSSSCEYLPPIENVVKTWCGRDRFTNLVPETTYVPGGYHHWTDDMLLNNYDGKSWATEWQGTIDGVYNDNVPDSEHWSTTSPITITNYEFLSTSSIEITYTYNYIAEYGTAGFDKFQVSYRLNGGNWINLNKTHTNGGTYTFVISNLNPGTHYKLEMSGLNTPTNSQNPAVKEFTMPLSNKFLDITVNSITPHSINFTLDPKTINNVGQIYYNVSTKPTSTVGTYYSKYSWETGESTEITINNLLPGTTYYLSFVIPYYPTTSMKEILYLNSSGYNSNQNIIDGGSLVYEYQFTTPGFETNVKPTLTNLDPVTGTANLSYYFTLNSNVPDSNKVYIRYKIDNGNWIYWDGVNNINSTQAMPTYASVSGINVEQITFQEYGSIFVEVSLLPEFPSDPNLTASSNPINWISPLRYVDVGQITSSSIEVKYNWDKNALSENFQPFYKLYDLRTNEIIYQGDLNKTSDTLVFNNLNSESNYALEIYDKNTGEIYFSKDQKIFSTSSALTNIAEIKQIDETSIVVQYEWDYQSTKSNTPLYSLDGGTTWQQLSTSKSSYTNENWTIIENIKSNTINQNISFGVDLDSNFTNGPETSLSTMTFSTTTSILEDINVESILDSSATLNITTKSTTAPLYIKIENIVDPTEIVYLQDGTALNGTNNINNGSQSYSLKLINLIPNSHYRVYYDQTPITDNLLAQEFYPGITTKKIVSKNEISNITSTTATISLETYSTENELYVAIVDQHNNSVNTSNYGVLNGQTNLNTSNTTNYSLNLIELNPQTSYKIYVDYKPINLSFNNSLLYINEFWTNSSIKNVELISLTSTSISFNVNVTNSNDVIYIKAVDEYNKPLNSNNGALDGVTSYTGSTTYQFTISNLLPQTEYDIFISNNIINSNKINDKSTLKYSVSTTDSSNEYSMQIIDIGATKVELQLQISNPQFSVYLLVKDNKGNYGKDQYGNEYNGKINLNSNHNSNLPITIMYLVPQNEYFVELSFAPIVEENLSINSHTSISFTTSNTITADTTQSNDPLSLVKSEDGYILNFYYDEYSLWKPTLKISSPFSSNVNVVINNSNISMWVGSSQDISNYLLTSSMNSITFFNLPKDFQIMLSPNDDINNFVPLKVVPQSANNEWVYLLFISILTIAILLITWYFFSINYFEKHYKNSLKLLPYFKTFRLDPESNYFDEFLLKVFKKAKVKKTQDVSSILNNTFRDQNQTNPMFYHKGSKHFINNKINESKIFEESKTNYSNFSVLNETFSNQISNNIEIKDDLPELDLSSYYNQVNKQIDKSNTTKNKEENEEKK